MRGALPNGFLIRKLRRLATLTQEQLAHLAECDVKTIRKAEKGSERLDLRVLVGIAHTLQCDVHDLVRSEPGERAASAKFSYKSIVLKWHDLLHDSDVDGILELHTDDTLLEVHGADGLPEPRSIRGKPQLSEHLTQLFQKFKMESVTEETTYIDVVDNLVFLRTTPTIRYLPNDRTYRSRHLNEFEFRADKIARRTVIANYNDFCQVLL